MMSQPPRRKGLPPLGKRKREENIASSSTTISTSKPPLIPVPMAAKRGHNKPKPSNLLLAGYLANEFLRNGTLFGRTLESAKARPGPFIYSNYLGEPNRGIKLQQQAKGKLNLAQVESKSERKLQQEAKRKLELARAEVEREVKLHQQAKGNPNLAQSEPENKEKLQQEVKGKLYIAHAEPKSDGKLQQEAKEKLDLARAEPKNEEKLQQQAKGMLDLAQAVRKSKGKLQVIKGKLDTARDEPKCERKLQQEAKGKEKLNLAQATSLVEPKRKKPVKEDSEAKSRNLDHHYREVSKLFKTNQVHIKGIVNPKQLYQWIRRW